MGALLSWRTGWRSGSRFVRQAERSARYAEAVLIHEALHSLGLGENPPLSDYITERIQARCG